MHKRRLPSIAIAAIRETVNLPAQSIRVRLPMLVLLCSGVPAVAPASHAELVELFLEFRAMTGVSGDEYGALPVVDPVIIEAEALALDEFQARLRAIDPSAWPIPEQVDYHLVRAELNGLQFRHRVTRPWFRDPGTYSDIVYFLGELRRTSPDHDPREVLAVLEALPDFLGQAMENLADVDAIPGDLALLAARDLRNGDADFAAMLAEAPPDDPQLLDAILAARQANAEFLAWLETNSDRMTAPAGIDRDNYNWLLKNVYLFPYNWNELSTIVELEDNRVRTFQRLEENRNRALPEIQPVQSQDEYRRSVATAIDDLMNFVRDENIFSMPDNQWTLQDAMAFSVANAPHGELLDDSPHLWFEMATTLRGVGHHMLMVVGKAQFMKLLRDRSQQLGDEFELQAFMDEFFESGLIPMSLIRWEMTGLDDEMLELLE